MLSLPVLVDVHPAGLDTLPCCGIEDPAHPGRLEKTCWLKSSFKLGLRAKVLLSPANKQCGYIEYLPGEYAWRGVDAAGYMFIHCVFTYRRQYRRQGLARMMLQACADDARDAGMFGVAVMVREGPWLAGPPLFLTSGFRVAASAPPDYQLLVRKFDPSAPDPAFKGSWEEKLAKYGAGLTIVRSRQCPHIAKFAGDIAESARREYGLEPRIVELKTCRQAQNAPTPFAVFSLIYNGRLLADHPISRTRFRNIMRTVTRT